MRKDLCLLLQRSRAMIIMVGVGVIIGFSTDGGFLIGYLTMISAILSIGTISYDEFDNGYPFLLTLPVTRKSYVMAKYLFCLASNLAVKRLELFNSFRASSPVITQNSQGVRLQALGPLMAAWSS